MGTLYNFPSKFIYYDKLDNHKELKANIFDSIMSDVEVNREAYLSDHSNWGYKVLTNFFDGNGGRFFNDYPKLNDAIWKVFDAMLLKATLSYKIKGARITKIWYSVYEKGFSQVVHQHSGSDISGIYIVHATEPNKTVFYSGQGYTLLNETKPTEELEEGTLILFPSNLDHYVNPIEDKLRVTIAFNISVDYA